MQRNNFKSVQYTHTYMCASVLGEILNYFKTVLLKESVVCVVVKVCEYWLLLHSPFPFFLMMLKVPHFLMMLKVPHFLMMLKVPHFNLGRHLKNREI